MPVVDSQSPVPRPDSDLPVQPPPTKVGGLCKDPILVHTYSPSPVLTGTNYNVSHAEGPIGEGGMDSSFLGPTVDGVGVVDPLSSPNLLANLRIRTPRSMLPVPTLLALEDLSNTIVPDQSIAQAIDCSTGTNSKPLSPRLSSQDHSAGSKRWADYSSDLDSGPDPALNSLGGSRVVLSPQFSS
ncbi:unnamed protein product [Calypogeia fissa]